MLFVFGLSLVLVGRLVSLQVMQHEAIVSRAGAQQSISRSLPAERGEIFLSDRGEPYFLAVNR